MEVNSFLKIYKEVIANKDLFECMSEKFYHEIINPIWENNSKRKLEFFNLEDGSVVFARHNYELQIQIKEHSKPNWDLIELTEGFVRSEPISQSSFLWYVVSDLQNLTKYFKISTIKGWAFNSGIYYNIEDTNLPYALEGDRMYSVSWLEWAKNGFEPEHKSVVADICNLLKISKVEDMVSDGYHSYLSSKRVGVIKTPSVIRNKMDYMMWCRCIDRLKITSKNFNQLNYFNKEHLIGGEDGYKLEVWVHLYNQEGLAKKQYFIPI